MAPAPEAAAMRVESLPSRTVDLDRPALDRYGAVFLLVLATELLQLLVLRGDDTVGERALVVLGPRPVGTVVYASIGLAALVTVWLLARRRGWVEGALALEERFTLAGATTFLLLVGAYALHGGVDLQALPGDPLPALLVAVLAMGLPVHAYARRRGLAVPLGLPAEGVLARAPALGGAGALVAVAQLALVARVRDPVVFGTFARDLSAVDVLTGALVPGLLVGGGGWRSSTTARSSRTSAPTSGAPAPRPP